MNNITRRESGQYQFDQTNIASVSCTYGGSIRAQRSPPKPVKQLPTATAKRRRSWSPADPEYIDSYAKQLRTKLHSVLSDFGTVRQVALTVDPAERPDPDKAFQTLQRQVSELFRKLRRNGRITDRRYVWFLEFHKSGFPHFHVLFSSERNILPEIRTLWTTGFAFERRFRTNYDHLGYVTKQLTRRAVENLPTWFAELPTTKARRYRTSQGFFGTKAKPKRSTTTAPRTSRTIKTVAEKQAELSADPRGDVWLFIPRRTGKPIKLNTAAIADRSELHRLFGTSQLTIDQLGTVQPTTPAEREIVEALFRSFAPGYQTNSRKSLSVIAKATADHNRLSAIYGQPIKTETAEGLVVESPTPDSPVSSL